MAAVLLALPWLMYQVWAFVAPGLYSHEKSCAAADRLRQPAGLRRHRLRAVLRAWTGCSPSSSASRPTSVAATPDIASYLELSCRMYLAFGVAFQVPIVVMLLVRMEHGHGREAAGASAATSSWWRSCVAAVLTPPDVVSSWRWRSRCACCTRSASGRRSSSSSTPRRRTRRRETREVRRLPPVLSGVRRRLYRRSRCAGIGGLGRRPGVTSSSILSLAALQRELRAACRA